MSERTYSQAELDALLKAAEVNGAASQRESDAAIQLAPLDNIKDKVWCDGYEDGWEDYSQNVKANPLPTSCEDYVARQRADAELPWRRLLFMNHGQYLPNVHSRYGDDGEMQCCGLDFKRASIQFIEEALTERALRAIEASRRGK